MYPFHEFFAGLFSFSAFVNGSELQVQLVGLFDLWIGLEQRCRSDHLMLSTLIGQLVKYVSRTCQQLFWGVSVTKSLDSVSYAGLAGPQYGFIFLVYLFPTLVYACFLGSVDFSGRELRLILGTSSLQHC